MAENRGPLWVNAHRDDRLPRADRTEHASWCNTLPDDESDYEWLADAGECTCGFVIAQ